MSSINNVARRVLSHYESITTMKLQKLVFYAQAHSLATTGRPLFDADFYAWRAGPVSPELFQYHRGSFFVSLDNIPASGEPMNENENILVDEVCGVLGKLSGKELSIRTHNEDPWLDARGGLGSAEPGHEIISKATIASYYAKHPVIPVI